MLTSALSSSSYAIENGQEAIMMCTSNGQVGAMHIVSVKIKKLRMKEKNIMKLDISR